MVLLTLLMYHIRNTKVKGGKVGCTRYGRQAVRFLPVKQVLPRKLGTDFVCLLSLPTTGLRAQGGIDGEIDDPLPATPREVELPHAYRMLLKDSQFLARFGRGVPIPTP